MVLVLGGCTQQVLSPVAEMAPASAETDTPTPVPSPSPSPIPTAISTPVATPVPQSAEPNNAFVPGGFFHGHEGVFSDMDLDGDGLDDTFSIDTKGYVLQMALTLGSGLSRELETECMWFETFDIADLTGDGKLELIAMADTGGNGGAGCHDVVVFHVGDGEIKLLPLPSRGDSLWKSGYEFTITYMDDYKAKIVSERYADTVNISEDEALNLRSMAVYDDEGTLLDETYSEYQSGTDGIHTFELLRDGDAPASIRLYQYVFCGGHADGIGDGISTIRWDGTKFALIEQDFTPYYEN
jgi:hypothetical protein